MYPAGLHCLSCTVWIALTGLHCLDCTHWIALSKLHSMDCTVWIAFTGLHCLGCTHWIALSWLHCLNCTQWIALSGFHSLDCTVWIALTGLHGMNCTVWIACIHPRDAQKAHSLFYILQAPCLMQPVNCIMQGLNNVLYFILFIPHRYKCILSFYSAFLFTVQKLHRISKCNLIINFFTLDPLIN